MIYIGFVFDYFLLFFCPIKTYFIIKDIERNSFFSIIVVGLILDLLYHTIGLNLIILLVIYFLLKIIKIKKKYYYIKEIILYLIYFNLLFFINGFNLNYYIYYLVGGFILQIIYIFYSNWLLN